MIYLDNNATTPLLPEVLEAMRPWLENLCGNPSSSHSVGRRARRALEDSREEIAALLGAWPDELIFTSGATESNNLALRGLAGPPPGLLLSSAMEHPSVVEPLRRLAHLGFEYLDLPVDETGHIQASPPREWGGNPSEKPTPPLTQGARLNWGARLVAVQLANHEVGTVQDVEQLATALPEETLFHCDAVQAVGKIAVNFHRLQVSTLAFTGHKFHGPRGIGGLLVRRGINPTPLLQGGHQQRGIRPGTEPVPLIVGLTTALRLAVEQRETRRQRVLALRQTLLNRLTGIGGVLNGPEEGGLPHTLNVSFPGIRGDLLLLSLDLAGIACSTGSACSSGSLLPSPVLQAMKVGSVRLTSALRFSLNHLLTEEEIVTAGERIVAAVERLRSGAVRPTVSR